MRLVIPYSLPSLNEYIDACRRGKYAGSAFKGKYQHMVMAALRRQIRTPLREPVVMRYTWVEKNKMRDKDNVSSFGRKIIQDALVNMGALRDDGWSNIRNFADDFAVDRDNPRIEIEIEEAEL